MNVGFSAVYSQIWSMFASCQSSRCTACLKTFLLLSTQRLDETRYCENELWTSISCYMFPANRKLSLTVNEQFHQFLLRPAKRSTPQCSLWCRPHCTLASCPFSLLLHQRWFNSPERNVSGCTCCKDQQRARFEDGTARKAFGYEHSCFL